jgi:Zn-dependent protease with chaperone function
MTNEEFEALVGRLEHRAKSGPASYKMKVLLLAVLGNAYVGAMLVLILAVMLALAASVTVLKALAVKWALIVGYFLWRIIKALWVKIDPPSGTEITAGEAPRMFDMIEELRRGLNAPRFHHVLMTNEFNAGVVQTPRLGIFGWPRNYLLIGLPLMKCLTVEQFKAVLAHEFGHLARGHGQVSNWIYRQRLRWGRLLEVLDASESKGGLLFKPFLTWFAPYFNAYSFPLARANEYEADAASVRLTSSAAAAEALTSVNVVDNYLSERYWPQIYKQADEHPQPAFAPYVAMGRGVAAELDGASIDAWLTQALARKTDSVDTHPSLADRLKALGASPRLALPSEGQAADRLLGTSLKAIAEGFDQQWKDEILPSWEERHRRVQDDRRQLAELNERFAGGAELTLQEAYDRARLTETAGRDADGALAQFRALHDRAPDDPVVCMALGARLLDRDDSGGCALVEKAMRLDEGAIVDGCVLLRDYHWRTGGKEEANAWHKRLVDRSALEQAAERERGEVRLNDHFERHGLSDEAAAKLRAALKAIPGLRRAYYVRKRVKHFPDRPCYVLGYRATGLFQLYRERRVKEVLGKIQESVTFPGETIIINVDGPNYQFDRKFWWMRGAKLL